MHIVSLSLYSRINPRSPSLHQRSAAPSPIAMAPSAALAPLGAAAVETPGTRAMVIESGGAETRGTTGVPDTMPDSMPDWTPEGMPKVVAESANIIGPDKPAELDELDEG